MIKNINTLHKNNSTIFGNKAAFLGQLSSKFTVPQGIALSTLFFDEYLSSNKFPFWPDDYFGKNCEIQSFIKQADFNQAQKNMIENNLPKTVPKLIVRSSAICEDTGKNSMAGMFISKEASNNTDDILSAIKECYCSLFSDNVLNYFHERNMDFSLLKMGVAIQEYVEGVYSGVIFTADTKNHDASVIYLNYVQGNCGGFVDGSAKSCFLKINKETKEVIESNCYDSDGVQLPDKLIASLNVISLSIEKEMGFYADIEWTYNGDEVYILQARPITTIKERRVEFVAPENEKNKDLFLLEHIPLRPFFENYFDNFFSASGEGLIRTGSKNYPVMKCLNSYMYIYYKNIENEAELREKAVERLKELTDKGLAMFDNYCLPQLLAFKNPMDKYIENNEKNSNSDIADFLLMALEYDKCSHLNHWEADFGQTYIDVFREYLNSIYGNISTEQLYELIYAKTFKTKERELLLEFAGIFQNNPYLAEILNSSTYPLIIYERLKLTKDWNSLNELIQKYLTIFGMNRITMHRITNLPEYLLREKPQYVVERVKQIISQNKDEYLASILKLQESKAKIKQQIIKTIAEELHEDFERNLSVAEKTFASIDNHHYYCEDMGWGYVKTALTAAANRLKDNGLIETDDDIYFLYSDEICGLLKKTVSYIDIKTRKIDYEEKCKVLAPNKILPEAAKLSEKDKKNKSQDSTDTSDKSNSKILNGVSSLNKIVEGTILNGGRRVPNKIPDDCILVVPSGRAGDLFPVIDKIKGLIVVEGSPFDHMGIIAREMNIPALYYVKGALNILKTGDKVVLDGETGTLTIL